MDINTEDILVSYLDIPFAKKSINVSSPIELSEEEFNALKENLKYYKYNNIYTPSLYLQITGRCNFNCLHCFSAKDNSPLLNEMSLEKINELLDMANKCGIDYATITGGEPTVHPKFKEIVKAFADHNIEIKALVTNGYLLTQEIIDLFTRYNMHPIIRLSFDGLGKHDYMRGVIGAQEAAINAIKLCIENNFNHIVNIQVNKQTVDAIPETIRFLDKMGVKQLKLIKTTPTPRWEKNSNNNDFTYKEFFEYCYKVIDDYSKEDHQMAINIWLLNTYNPKSIDEKYSFPSSITKMHPEEDNQCICQGFKDNICVSAEGNVYPCFQMQGILDSRKISLGNVFSDGLQNILQNDSKLFKFKNHTRAEKLSYNSKCKQCEFSNLCATGCPGLSLLHHGNMLEPNDYVCEFYESKMYEHVLELAGYDVYDDKEENQK